VVGWGVKQGLRSRGRLKVKSVEVRVHERDQWILDSASRNGRLGGADAWAHYRCLVGGRSDHAEVVETLDRIYFFTLGWWCVRYDSCHAIADLAVD
jgi:hypothetical protein